MTTDKIYQQFEYLLNRSEWLRKTVLVLANSAGCLLMLSPALSLLAATSSAIYIYSRIQGPLDWFMFECMLGVTAFSAYLTWQLLNIRPEQPEGVRLKPEQAPEIFKMLERRSNHFRIKPVTHINLSTGTELKIVGTPVGAVPIYHRHTLCAGTPLLFFLGKGQFRLGLAGAVAVAATKKTCLSGWLVQAANDWPLIISALKRNDSLLSRLLLKPVDWLATHIEHLSIRLRADWRQQQSRWVLDNSDEQSTADYLANHLVAAAFLEKQYWPMIFKAADRCPTPVVKAFSHLPLLLRKTLNKKHAERWLLEAQAFGKQQQTGVRDLLAELRIDQLAWPGLPAESAFDTLFGNKEILKQLDTYWQNTIETQWRDAHARYKNDEFRFNQLKIRAREQGLRGASALKFVKLAPQFVDQQGAIAIYKEMYNNNFDDAKVCFACGLALLRSSSVNDGIRALQRAATLDPALAKRAHALVSEHGNTWVDEEPAHQHITMEHATA
jgi:hypothetical protein